MGLLGASAHPLTSHHLTVFEVTADSYWAVMAPPLSLAQVPAFTLKRSQTRSCPCLSGGGRGASGLVPADKKPSPGFHALQVHLVYYPYNKKCVSFDLLLLFRPRSRLTGT